MVYAQVRIHSGEWDAQNSLEFWNTNRLPNPGEKIRLSGNGQKKREFVES